MKSCPMTRDTTDPELLTSGLFRTGALEGLTGMKPGAPTFRGIPKLIAGKKLFVFNTISTLMRREIVMILSLIHI